MCLSVLSVCLPLWGLCCILFVSVVLGSILECRLIPHVMSRVQRKLILPLALRASCNQPPLARESFLQARKKFFASFFFNICFYFMRPV